MFVKNTKTRRYRLVTLSVAGVLCLSQVVVAGGAFSEMVSLGASWDMEQWTNGMAWPSWLASELDIPSAATTGQHYGDGCAATSAWRGQARRYLREHTPDDTTLFTLAAAVGDYARACVGSKPPIETSLTNVERAIDLLADAGGKHFVVPTFSYAKFSGAALRMDRDQVVELNTSLDALLPELEQRHGITIYRPDFFQLWADMTTAPADYGFTNINNTMRGVTNPHEYTWWDFGPHPTTAAHRLMGHAASEAMNVAIEPRAVVLGAGETSYRQDFQQLGQHTEQGSLPDGWVSVTGGAIYTSLTRDSMPRTVGASGSLIRMGRGDDGALGMGITNSADENEIQLYAELADNNFNLLRLRFDIETGGSNKGLAADLGEAAFHVVVESDQGDRYAPVIDFGTLTTGAVIGAAWRVDSNAPENRLSFDSQPVLMELADATRLRVRWIVPADSQTTGWTFGLDNVELTVLGRLEAGDADQDLDFDQFDLVLVQQSAKYLPGQPAIWGEGDWNGAPGGYAGNPPEGDGVFDQLDVVAALSAGAYLTGRYAALDSNATAGDEQTSIGYDADTGEVWVDAPANKELTSINIDSHTGIFTGDAAQTPGESLDNDADNNIFKATFGSGFGSISLGNVARGGLKENSVLDDLTVVGSSAGGGSLGDVDLTYVPVPEPAAIVLLALGMFALVACARKMTGNR